MSVRRKSSKKALSAFTSLMVLFALVVPFTGTALAQHVSGVAITPTTDSAPAGTCNAFTVTLTDTDANGNTVRVAGETVDIIVQDTDADDNSTVVGGANESDVTFCNVTNATQPANGSDEFGPNPQPVTPNNANQNTGDDNVTTRQQGSTTPTDANGQITFGILSNEAGTFSVSAFFDENNDNDPTGEFTANASKTFTAALQSGNNAVETLDCSPETDANPEGTVHEFTCVARDVNGNVVSGATVTFSITSGPNAEEFQNVQRQCGSFTGTAPNRVFTPGSTDQTGTTTCFYQDEEDADTDTGTAVTSPPGQDTIVAFVNQTPGAGQTGTPGFDAAFEPSDTITKNFVGDANNIECDDDEGGAATAGDIVTIECLVTDEVGQPVPGVEVRFEEDGAGVFRGNESCVTGEDGTCDVQIETDESEAGQNIVVTATIVQGTASGQGTTNTTGTFVGDTNCQGTTGDAQTGTNANCTDTVTVELAANQVVTQCNNGVDDDGDGDVDFPADNGCVSEADASELGDPADPQPDPEEIRRNRDVRITALRHVDLPGKRKPALLVKGRVTAENFDECAAEVPIKVQIKAGGEFITRKSDTTNARGVFKVLIRDVQARYRAQAPRFQIEDTENNQINICVRASDVRRHRH